MSGSALRHMMLHGDTLADEFDAILGYRTSHSGLVLPAALVGVGANDLLLESGDHLLLETGYAVLMET